MAEEILLSGVGDSHHEDALKASLARVRPKVIGIVSAFVSVEGVERSLAILNHCGKPRCRLVAGIDNAITHPEALEIARDAGWLIRLGHGLTGIFHPKLVVAGQGFRGDGTVRNLSCVYVGSSNLTGGGYRRNAECGLLAEADDCLEGASSAFASLWNSANLADETALRNYAARFAEKNRKRRAVDLEALGVDDAQPKILLTPRQLIRERPPRRGAIGVDFIVAAWTGLQSFTGEYRFQIEFPRTAGEVVGRLIGTHIRPDGRVDVYCSDDGQTRRMQYRFYADNSMFRLNVQNDVPGVQWARQHKDGVALVEQGPRGGAPIRLRILQPGVEASDTIRRSVALGTWGRTPTRPYGWF
jgi:hypothetical protein